MLSRLRCYNQYPGNYQNFDSMREDLQRIRNMGFKEVWVNPFYKPCQENPVVPSKILSPYAMQEETLYSRYGESIDAVHKYVEAAAKLGLASIFDFVPNHVAVDHRFVNGDKELFEKYQIDTSKWFRRDNTGKLLLHNQGGNNWPDIAFFNFDDPIVTEQVVKYFLKPFIEFNIKTLGFRGVRIDFPRLISYAVMKDLMDFAKDCCLKNIGVDLIIIGETIGGPIEEYLCLKNSVTYTMNNVYWMPDADENKALWQQDDNWFAQRKGVLQPLAPSAGYPGSHDEIRCPKKWLEQGITDKNILQQRMKEKLAIAAFASDAGWILQHGDEFGALEKVDVFNPVVKEYHLKDKNLQMYDLSDYVTKINSTLSHMPAPAFPEWTQRVFSEKYPNLVIFIIHPGEGFSKIPCVVVANTDNNKVLLTQADINEVMLANQRNNSPDKIQIPDKLFLCGDNLAADNELKSKISTFEYQKLYYETENLFKPEAATKTQPPNIDKPNQLTK